MSAEPARFRAWMGRWPTGVSIVTAAEAGRRHGLTVNAFLSVALSPPTVLVSLSRDTDTEPVIARTGRFAVNLLAYDQRPLSERFARQVPPEEKFEGLPIREGRLGIPLLEGTLGSLECTLAQSFTSGDHQLLLGTVEQIVEGREAPPLLFYRSHYGESDPAGRLTLAGAPP
ncbi:MAG: flavin reductase family protein [Thermoplasmata archaeon]|nr:flavin reductase family protein [Thermoplasmata archaeon]MCI4340852.1 flavin reductase family protein [Thermoplasmata archaeon]